MSLDIIADEIHWRGYLVALLAPHGVPATIMAEFTDGLDSGTLFEGEQCADCDAERGIIHSKDCPQYEKPKGEAKKEDEGESEYDCALDDVLRSMKAFNKGGLIKFSDLESVLKQLKEEVDING